MPLELIYASERYLSNRPGMHRYLKMPLNDRLAALNNSQGALFEEITGLVLFLTPYCNFMPCDHCAVHFQGFASGGTFPVMPKEAAYALADLVSPAKQFTVSGGEVFLLDPDVRDHAENEGYIPKGLAEKLHDMDYLPGLIKHLSERLRSDWDAIDRLSPINRTGTDRFLRIPTNGYLLPYLDAESRADPVSLRKSELYKILKGYRGINFQLSIGPFQELKYQRSGMSLQQKIRDLVQAARIVSHDLCEEHGEGKLVNFSIGALFTYLHGDPAQFDQEISARHGGLEVPTQDFDKNEALKLALSLGLNVEMQRVIGISNGARLNGAVKDFRAAPKKHISEVDELYAAVLRDGKIGIFTNTVHMYEGNDSNAVMLFRT